MRNPQKIALISLIVLPIIIVLMTIWALLADKPDPEKLASISSSQRPKTQQQQDFDYYVLALSWSPTFCQNSGPGTNRLQCGSDKSHGFIVHGLWPQYERSGWPEFCDTPHQLDRTTQAEILDLIPSQSLVTHQWTKHGSCSGLSAPDFFATLRTARAQFTMPFPNPRGGPALTISPQEIKRRFRATNPTLPPNSLKVICNQTALREVRICLAKDLTPRNCSPSVGNGCRNTSITLPPVR